MLQGFFHLFVQHAVIFPEIVAALRMSDNDILYARVHKHFRRDLACICALFLVIHIFSANCDIRSLYCFHNRNYVDCRHTVDDFHLVVRHKRL